MRIVVAADSLAGLGGTETYTLTVADQLQRLGHDVVLLTNVRGRATDRAALLGIRVADGMPADPDVLLVQDAAIAAELAGRHPTTPQVFVAHSDIFDLQLPLQLPGATAAVVTMYDRVDRRIRALAIQAPIVRLAQPIDVERFTPGPPLPARPRRALAFGNYVHGQRLTLLERACERAGIELRHVGFFGEGQRDDPERLLAGTDVVFGKARVILEAMACARAAYVFDHNGAEGWVTAARAPLLAADNFGGQSHPIATTEDALVADLARYDAADGLAGRDFVVAHHASSKHAAALVDVLRAAARGPGPSEGPPFDELARVIRLRHRADAEADVLRAELERAGGERRREEDRADELGAELAAARADAADARAVTAGVAGSRRWRAVQAALAPVDRLRARRHATPPAPFVVGVPRSGTTLLRLQLDAHPALAIPPETGVGLVAGTLLRRGVTPDGVATALAGIQAFGDLGFPPDELRRLLRSVRPWSAAAGVRAIYRAYAARHGKPRWGDKTPVHCLHMPELGALLPEARFVHLIRDPRAVASSLHGLHFAPGDGSLEAIGAAWRSQVAHARAAGARLGDGRYTELRYEALVARPEAALRTICAAIDLPFDPAMLQAHERATARLAELPEARADGGVLRTRGERLGIHANTTLPPDPALADAWRDRLGAAEIATIERAAGPLMTELGYEAA